MISDVLFSCQTDEWVTPDDLYQRLNDEFRFNLDPCSTDENHKTVMYYTKREDGLKQPWGGCRVWCNPPYSNVKAWIRKAYYEAQHPGTIVVMLIPARTDTRWFHDYVLHRSEIRFIKGRLRFSDSKYDAPFPSMLVIFRAPGM